jgi:translation initiation factor 1 (eIF-1/SUI1)
MDNDLLKEIDEELNNQVSKHNKLHIRLQQRNGRKSITIVEG